MIAKFIGGTWDGKERDVIAGARYYIVPVTMTTAHADDFNFVPLSFDEDGEPVIHRAKPQLQRYKRTAFDRETKTVTYTFDGLED